MNAGFHGSDHVHRLGESAMHPIAPRWPRHGTLRLMHGAGALQHRSAG
ncbi:MAG: hypothetical protein Q4G70_12420 [Pseudomonadota bacterium]|nr:hypothetical protein [Pseudomonadota bacterium]